MCYGCGMSKQPLAGIFTPNITPVNSRGELDEDQEVNYPAIIKKLLATGYTGYIGQEFIPTRDPLAGLKQAVKLCDV